MSGSKVRVFMANKQNLLASNSSTKLYKGISIRKQKKKEYLQICFTKDGVTIRHSLKLTPTTVNINYAKNLLNNINDDINSGRFDYMKYFPKSKRALQQTGGYRSHQTIEEALLYFLDEFEKVVQESKKSDTRFTRKQKRHLSTLTGYRKIVNNELIPFFGKKKLCDLQIWDIEEWCNHKKVSAKTIKNRISILRMIYQDLISYRLIKTNPVDDFLKTRKGKDILSTEAVEVDPFTEIERDMIIEGCSGQFKNYVQTAFWTGMRTSELLGLKVSDIDFLNGKLYVTKARVGMDVSITKTKSSTRKISLLPKAIDALKKQVELLIINDPDQLIFNNPNTNKPWSSSNKINEQFQKVLQKINIRSRASYNMRHSFASILLSNGENPYWVSTQMGHSSVNITNKHYARWIGEEYKFLGEY